VSGGISRQSPSTSTTLPIFKLEFRPEAIREWRKLDSSAKSQFEKKLRERLAHPRVVAAQLRDLPDCYKIKLRKAGYRLIYRVEDDRVVVIVLAVGKRARNEAYEAAASRVD
jgi:mRNA interferase RelE/StbE